MEVNEVHRLSKILTEINDQLQHSHNILKSIDSKICSKSASQSEDEKVVNRLFRKREAMEYLGITESTYYRWINEEKLKPRGGPGQDYYYESDLLLLKTRRRYRQRG